MMAQASPPEPSSRRDLAHELRNALSPIASSVNLLRLSNFDPNTSRASADAIDRGLRRALAAIEAFVRTEAGELPAIAASATTAARPAASPDGEQTPAGVRAAARRANGAHAGTRILIVDDNVEVRKAFRESLLALGYVVSEAKDAEEALRRMGDESPRVALIDVHLPGMNGYRLAAEIKARTGSAIRLIMLSAMTMDSATRRLARQVGFDDCLDKVAGPFELDRLLRAG